MTQPSSPVRKLTVANSEIRFFNPTNKALDLKYNSLEFHVEPFEEFIVDNRFMAKHFEKKYKERGLVNITFTDGDRKIHKDYDAFFKAKCLQGLTALRDFARLTLAREEQAVNESSLKNGSSIDSLYFKVGSFKEKVKEVDDAIAKMMAPDKAADKKQAKNEPRANQDSDKIQA